MKLHLTCRPQDAIESVLHNRILTLWTLYLISSGSHWKFIRRKSYDFIEHDHPFIIRNINLTGQFNCGHCYLPIVTAIQIYPPDTSEINTIRASDIFFQEPRAESRVTTYPLDCNDYGNRKSAFISESTCLNRSKYTMANIWFHDDRHSKSSVWEIISKIWQRCTANRKTLKHGVVFASSAVKCSTLASIVQYSKWLVVGK